MEAQATEADRSTRPLKIGVPAPQLAGSDPARAALAAEAAGLDSMWWADRLAGWMPEGPHALVDPLPSMAVAGHATATLQLGTAVADVLRRHPAQLAQSALTVQDLSGGRLILGVGCGEAAGTVRYGMDFDRPVERLDEALHVVRALWRDGGPAHFAGRHYSLSGARCGLAAAVTPPPVWLASHGPRMLALTGELADGWLPTAGGPRLYAEQLGAIRLAEAAAGRPAGSVEAGAFVWIVASRTRADARRLLASDRLRALGLLLPKGALASSPLQHGPSHDLVGHEDTVALARQIDLDELAEVMPHGGPEDVAEELARYRAAGAEHMVVCDMAPLAGRDAGGDLRGLQLYRWLRDALVA
ncbi:MAG: LLM class flavin-dependent oxidoreductase [Actinomycetota bacterium]|nr:LLM class flavin-dependent oxidoreductase [Actinomycetota bacterium]